MKVYFNGDIMAKENVRISPDDRGFLLGDGAYEVILSYDGRLFALKPHMERLARGLGALRIPLPDLDALAAIPETLITENDLRQGCATVYLQVSRGAAPRKHYFPPAGTAPTVYAYASPFDSPEAEMAKGTRVIVLPDMRWARCDIKTISLQANVLACQRAKESGAYEAILVRDGAVTEGTHSSFAAVFGGQIHTYPESHYILPSITRQTILEICRELDIPTATRPVLVESLPQAQECMLLGTTTEVMPVVQIDDRQIADGRPGPITLRLQSALRKRIRGRA